MTKTITMTMSVKAALEKDMEDTIQDIIGYITRKEEICLFYITEEKVTVYKEVNE